MAKKTPSNTSSAKRETSDKDTTPETEEDKATEAPSGESKDDAGQAETPEVHAGDEAPTDNAGPKSDEAAEDVATEAADTIDDDTETADTGPDAEPAPAEADAPTDAAPADDDKTETPAAAPVATEQVVIRKGGFVPLLLGGVAAGLIGFGAGYYVTAQLWSPGSKDLDALRSATERQLQSQADRIADLSERVGAAAQGPDLSLIEQGQSDLLNTTDALAGRLAEIDEALSALTSRVAALEARPLAEGASDAAVAAYEAELKKLQEAMAAQRAEIAAMTEEARAMESSAQETAQATMRRAALSRIQTALDAGGGYSDALADLESAGMAVPEVLSQTAASGVATLAELQESFPDAARGALAAARDAAAKAGETGGFTAFLRTQLGARSLEPRAGDDPDAILSRAEAATREGRLTDALAEIDALPEVARIELSDWAGQAAERLRAVAAAQALSEKLN